MVRVLVVAPNVCDKTLFQMFRDHIELLLEFPFLLTFPYVVFDYSS